MKFFYLMLWITLCSLFCLRCEAKEYDWKAMPKAELHLHLGGSYPLNFLLEHATSEQALLLKEELEKIRIAVSYQSVFHVFKLVADIVNTEERVRAGTYALCQDLQADGVNTVEIRTGLKDLGNGLECYLKAVLQGIEQAQTAGFQAKLLLSLQRSSSLQIAEQTIDLALKYRSRGIVGIDISGNSLQGDIQNILSELKRAKRYGLALSVHMGEDPLEKDQMLILNELCPERIGHGVHLNSEAKEWILQRRIPIEVCLTSSYQVQMLAKEALHPGLVYARSGYPIVLCTDDPLIFQTSLSQEFERLSNMQVLSIDEIEQIRLNGFHYSF